LAYFPYRARGPGHVDDNAFLTIIRPPPLIVLLFNNEFLALTIATSEITCSDTRFVGTRKNAFFRLLIKFAQIEIFLDSAADAARKDEIGDKLFELRDVCRQYGPPRHVLHAIS
jgi:hypothetical protein